MESAGSKSMNRLWYWLSLVPLVLGASRALVKYIWWAAMHSALYGVPAEAGRLREADANIDFYLWSLIGLAVAASIVTTLLMSPSKSEAQPHRLKGFGRFVVAVVLVIGSIGIVAAAMSATGYFLK